MTILTHFIISCTFASAGSHTQDYDYVRHGNDHEVLLAKSYVKQLIACGPEGEETQAYLNDIDSGLSTLYVRTGGSYRIEIARPNFRLKADLDSQGFVTRLSREEEFPTLPIQQFSNEDLTVWANNYLRYASSNALEFRAFEGKNLGDEFKCLVGIHLRWHPQVVYGMADMGFTHIGLHPESGCLLRWIMLARPTLTHYDSALARPGFDREGLVAMAVDAYNSRQPFLSASATANLHFIVPDFQSYSYRNLTSEHQNLANQRKLKTFLIARFSEYNGARVQSVAIDAITGRFVAWRELDQTYSRSGFLNGKPGRSISKQIRLSSKSCKLLLANGRHLFVQVSKSSRPFNKKVPGTITVLSAESLHQAHWNPSSRQLKLISSGQVFDIEGDIK